MRDNNTLKHIKVGLGLSSLFTAIILFTLLFINDILNLIISISLVFIIAVGKEYIWDWKIKPYLSSNPKHWINKSLFGRIFLHYEQYYPPKRDWGDIGWTTISAVIGSVTTLIIIRMIQELIN